MSAFLQGAKGTAADKLRLGLVQLLAAESAPSEAELAELTGALTAAGVPDTTALRYVARLRRNRLVGSARPAPGALYDTVCVHLLMKVLGVCRLHVQLNIILVLRLATGWWAVRGPHQAGGDE